MSSGGSHRAGAPARVSAISPAPRTGQIHCDARAAKLDGASTWVRYPTAAIPAVDITEITRPELGVAIRLDVLAIAASTNATPMSARAGAVVTNATSRPRRRCCAARRQTQRTHGE